MNTVVQIQPTVFTSHSQHKHTHKQRMPITITNFHIVDGTLMRGAKPTQAQLQELKDNGVSRIISFCTNYDPLNPHARTIPDEAGWAKKLGMKFYWMPFRSKENPPRQYVEDFFKIIDDSRMKGEKVFVHCKHGSDRTGVMVALERLRQNMKLSDVIRELFAYGHNANHNQNIIPFIIDFKSEQNPINKRLSFLWKTIHNLIKKLITTGKSHFYRF